PFPEPTVLFLQLRDRMSSLPAAAQAEVQPFFLRPDNPQSFWYQSAASQSNANPRGPVLASLSEPNFKYVDTPHIRVWYDTTKSGHAEIAGHVQVEILGSNMWDKE